MNGLFLLKSRNNKYPNTETQTSSPKATNAKPNQRLISNTKCNSNPIAKAFTTTGTNEAMSKCLQNEIPIQLINVAKVPIKISQGPSVDKQLAHKQPKVSPTAKSLLKKQSKIKASASLNCICPKAIGDDAKVNKK